MYTSTRMLRAALRGNAAFSLVTGLALILFSGRIAVIIGIDPTIYLPLLGVSLIVFAMLVWLLSRMNPVSRRPVLLVILMDLLWVAGSAALLMAGVLSHTGDWTVLLVAVAVLFFAVSQYMGLRRTSE